MTQASFRDRCPLCESEKLIPRYKINGYSISRCRECSFVFVREKFSDSDLVRIYGPQQPDPVYEDPDNAENLNFYYRLLKGRIENRIPTGRILDVGCSEGQFLETMTGWDCYGTELAEQSYLVARKKFGADRVIATAISNTGFQKHSFDVITLQDVFDHMPDPLGALQDCISLLRPGGLLVIKVHNIACLYSRIAGRSFYALIPPYHLSYFSAKTLRLALGRTGFQYLGHEYLPHLLFLKNIFFRLSSNRRDSLYYRLYTSLSGTRFGNLRVKKNLRDLITVFAQVPLNSAG